MSLVKTNNSSENNNQDIITINRIEYPLHHVFQKKTVGKKRMLFFDVNALKYLIGRNFQLSLIENMKDKRSKTFNVFGKDMICSEENPTLYSLCFSVPKKIDIVPIINPNGTNSNGISTLWMYNTVDKRAVYENWYTELYEGVLKHMYDYVRQQIASGNVNIPGHVSSIDFKNFPIHEVGIFNQKLEGLTLYFNSKAPDALSRVQDALFSESSHVFVKISSIYIMPVLADRKIVIGPYFELIPDYYLDPIIQDFNSEDHNRKKKRKIDQLNTKVEEIEEKDDVLKMEDIDTIVQEAISSKQLME